ncbi:MAG: alpha/beta hydrolase [Rhodobacteraceae bacterium]|jgi:haloacetate dehalogenase|nr:alpha/beta hydrolase [Paracoccaceae bacterium]
MTPTHGRLDTGEVMLAWSAWGTPGDPGVILLHGFPQTRALWSRIGPAIAARGWHVLAPDLRGYGDSTAPAWAPDGEPHSFRAMARDVTRLMDQMGLPRAHIIGHDRGARVAHRLALDHPARVTSVALMDIAPTLHLLDHFDPPLARAYWHWTFLAQPSPFPETLIAHDPDRFFETCLVGWGAARLDAFDPDQLAAYRTAWARPQVIAAMCADYRATLIADHAHDRADLGAHVTAPALVLWGADGVMGRMYDLAALWAPRLTATLADTIPGGHFFPDTAPEATAQRLTDWLAAQAG